MKEGKKITDYAGIRKAVTNLDGRIETGRKATSADERRKNVDTVKGLIGASFVKAEVGPQIYGNHATTDIEAAIRRSEIELANYELKQGMLSLSDKREVDVDLVDKIIKTICAIANNGPDQVGKIVVGVTDKSADAHRIKKLDGVDAKKVGKRPVVGIAREATALRISTERYFSKWKDAIKASGLTPSLRDAVLSNMDFNSFYGLWVIVITVPLQRELSYVGEEVYWRNGDATELAWSPKQIASLAKRF